MQVTMDTSCCNYTAEVRPWQHACANRYRNMRMRTCTTLHFVFDRMCCDFAQRFFKYFAQIFFKYFLQKLCSKTRHPTQFYLLQLWSLNASTLNLELVFTQRPHACLYVQAKTKFRLSSRNLKRIVENFQHLPQLPGSITTSIHFASHHCFS